MTTPAQIAQVTGLLTTGALTVSLISACGGNAPSAACQKATAAANVYAAWVRQNTTYPNDDVSEGMGIQAHELGLLNAMSKAGCAPSTKISALPGN